MYEQGKGTFGKGCAPLFFSASILPLLCDTYFLCTSVCPFFIESSNIIPLAVKKKKRDKIWQEFNRMQTLMRPIKNESFYRFFITLQSTAIF